MSGASYPAGSAATAHPDHQLFQPASTSTSTSPAPGDASPEVTAQQNADSPQGFMNFSAVHTNLFKLDTVNIEPDPDSVSRVSSLSPTGSVSLHPRKPSPGLAARLKALGFGAEGKKEGSSSSHLEHVGRLDEDQLRQLDERHLANSASDAVAKKGRPWRGAGGALKVLRSKSSRNNLLSHNKEEAESDKDEAEENDTKQKALKSKSSRSSLFTRWEKKAAADTKEKKQSNKEEQDGTKLKTLKPKSSRSSLLSFHRKEKEEADTETEKEKDHKEEQRDTKPEPLPEITAASPLEMDTNKYRLPDHTNGNGTKALSDTRQEHLERDSLSQAQDEGDQSPPPPPPKDTPPLESAPIESVSDVVSYFNPLGLQRPGSIYTISRASFANQLAQLTSLQLPDAELLSSKISAIPTAQAAAKALVNAAEQIRMWISKASEVIEGLDSDDDVEWAAAAGREGYEEVENAIARFEELINVYVSAIEDLQNRDDIANVPSEDLQQAVTQMESIMAEWAKIRSALSTAKAQVETAMEWEELWNTVFGEIQIELDELSRLVFEMEERRHKSMMAVANGDAVDLGDLETIVEETPPTINRANRASMPAFPATPSSPEQTGMSQDDSSLLALFARMQPLRASLDFLPMRLSVFQARAEQTFPTACEELEERRATLEDSYKKLVKDAESLRKELGEDKWVLVFRGAGRQAQKMYESVDRSVEKLREAIDSGVHLTNPAVMSKKIESYEAKKTHYGPAIERVLSIIDKGVKDRLTVNGEILRLHTEMQVKWEDVKKQMIELDGLLEEVQQDKGQTLRDSISSMLSNDLSTLGSGNETPGSSPPSSVVMSSLGLDPVSPLAAKKTRSASTGSQLPTPSTSKRMSLAPPSRRPAGSRLSYMSPTLSSLASSPTRSGATTPMGGRKLGDRRPKWNPSVNTNDIDVGHNFKPLSLTTPSPYARRSQTPVGRSASKLPVLRSPLSRAASSSPPEGTPPRMGMSRLALRDRASTPGLSKPRLRTQTSAPASTTPANRRASMQPPRPSSRIVEEPRRAASSMAMSRRTSLLPQPKSSLAGPATGRQSSLGVVTSRFSTRKNSSSTADGGGLDTKQRWHY